jgi:hypothetical protein
VGGGIERHFTCRKHTEASAYIAVGKVEAMLGSK